MLKQIKIDSTKYVYFSQLINDFRVYKPNPNIISTAGDEYVIYGDHIENIAVLDPSGDWDKHKERKRIFGIIEPNDENK